MTCSRHYNNIMLRRNIYYRPLMSFLFARLQPFADIDTGEFSGGFSPKCTLVGLWGYIPFFRPEWKIDSTAFQTSKSSNIWLQMASIFRLNIKWKMLHFTRVTNLPRCWCWRNRFLLFINNIPRPSDHPGWKTCPILYPNGSNLYSFQTKTTQKPYPLGLRMSITPLPSPPEDEYYPSPSPLLKRVLVLTYKTFHKPGLSITGNELFWAVFALWVSVLWLCMPFC